MANYTTGGLAVNGAIKPTAMNSSMYGGGSLSVGSQPSTAMPQPKTNGVLSGSVNQGTGTLTGMINQPKVIDVSTPPVINVGGKSQVMKGNPDVLAQQQALNKLGAGLVEDGFAGPATKAAIAKYGSGSTGTTPGIFPTTSSDQYSRQTGQPNPGYINPNTPPAPSPTTYTPPDLGVNGVSQGGLIGNLVNQSQNGSLALNKAIQDKKDLEDAYAKQVAANAGNPIPLSDQVGRASIYATQFGTRDLAAQNAISQQQQAFGQQIQAGTNAASANAPVPNTPYALNPSNGTYTGSGVGNGTSAVDAVKNAGMLAGTQTGAAAVAGAGGQTAAQNAITSGTAPTNAAASLFGTTYPQVAQLQTTTSNIDQFGNLLLSNMQGLNPTILKGGNATISQIRGQLSIPQQAQFDTTFAQLRAQIASLLQSGGAQIPTQITADANKIIDGSAPLSTLKATLERIKTEGSILTSNLQSQQNVGGSVIGAPKAGGNSNPAGI